LHYLDQGRGPTLLLLHGLGGDHRVWDPLLPRLTEQFRVLAPELRGHGGTPLPEGSQPTFAEHLADLELLLASAGIERVHLVGLSAGALLSLRYTLDHPERVASLVSIAGAVNIDNHTRAILDRWVETYQKEGFEAYALRLAKDLYYPDWVEAHLDVVDRLRAEAAEAEYGSLLRWRKEIREFDLRGRVGKVRVPTLIIHAMDDQVVDVAHARLLRQSIPGAEFKLFAQTGHMVPTERPAETGAAIRDWVLRAEARAPSRPP
ncbi:MAG: alpha/beta fold hydrolase, partial [Thermoplasmata archaeon]